MDELRARIADDVFKEWVDALKACLYDRSLKTTLTPIVAKLSDMRIVNAELEYMVMEPRKEFITMVVLVVGNIPLLYFLNKGLVPYVDAHGSGADNAQHCRHYYFLYPQPM